VPNCFATLSDILALLNFSAGLLFLRLLKFVVARKRSEIGGFLFGRTSGGRRVSCPAFRLHFASVRNQDLVVEVVFSDRDTVGLKRFRSHAYRTKEACFNSYGPRCVVQQLESRKQYIRV
jgi:hypothetical protein